MFKKTSKMYYPHPLVDSIFRFVFETINIYILDNKYPRDLMWMYPYTKACIWATCLHILTNYIKATSISINSILKCISLIMGMHWFIDGLGLHTQAMCFRTKTCILGWSSSMSHTRIFLFSHWCKKIFRFFEIESW